jgi:hypothetical protein
MRAVRTVILASGIHGLLAMSAVAQTRIFSATQMVFGVGLATSRSVTHCSVCTSEPRDMWAGVATVSRAVGNRFLVGAEVGRAAKTETHGPDETRDSETWIAGTGRWYPLVEPGLFIGAGVGYAEYRGTYGTPSQNHWNTDVVHGAAVHGTIGYELRLVGQLTMQPFAEYLRTVGANATSTSGPVPTDVAVSHTALGLLVAWRGGRRVR